jgi:glyoxylase-like metal-dependent hydrolase (beta-lactamase superfamily II)
VEQAGSIAHEGIGRVVNRDFHSNTYLLAVGPDASCVIIDPGLDREAIAEALAQRAWTPRAVLCTHGHFDHIAGAAWLQTQYRVPVYLREADLKLAKMSNFMLAAFKLKQRIALPDFSAIDDAPLTCGDASFRFHALPGHTPGSAGITTGGLIFSGDSLYAHKTALSRLPGEDHALLRASLAHLFSWIGGDIRVLPGHGSSATIDEIRAHNEELRAFMEAA